MKNAKHRREREIEQKAKTEKQMNSDNQNGSGKVREEGSGWGQKITTTRQTSNVDNRSEQGKQDRGRAR